MTRTAADIRKLAQDRILLLDGAMGSMIQRYQLSEEDFRGAAFADWPRSLKGNNELLNLSRPDVVAEIHSDYLEAGSDIIETNTFNANAVSLADYGMAHLAYEINVAAAQIARKIVDEYTAKNPNKPRFVAGAIGPTNKTASLSPDVNDASARSIGFDEL